MTANAAPLNEIEQRICTVVVRRFLEEYKPTPRRILLKEFKGSLAVPLQQLVQWSVLKPGPLTAQPEEIFLPACPAFEYCIDAEVRTFARSATELVLRAIRDLLDKELETETTDQRQYTPAEVQQAAQALDSKADAKAIRVGLYLAKEFGVFYLMRPDAQQIFVEEFRPNERIYTVTNSQQMWEDHIGSFGFLRAGQWPTNSSAEILEDADGPLFEEPRAQQHSRRVFIVHGHADETRRHVADFLASLGLEPIILHEQPNKGRTIIQKFQDHSETVGFAVVLLTPDDFGGPEGKPTETKPRARQNVILELGYFLGKLDRSRVCSIYVEGVELPSDLLGVLYIPYDEGGEWRAQLEREIRAAGIQITRPET